MTQFSNKFKKNPAFDPFFTHLPHLWGKIFFPGKSASATHNFIWVLAPCQNLEKGNDTIQRKRPDRWTEGWTEGRKDG